MSVEAIFVMATFTVPEEVGINPQGLLMMLPLVAAIAVVYKATKLSTITVDKLLKEAAVLFGSIIIFMGIAALVLYALARLITE